MNEQPNAAPDVLSGTEPDTSVGTASDAPAYTAQPDAQQFNPQQNIPYNGQPNVPYNTQQNVPYNGQPNMPYNPQQNTPYNGQPSAPYYPPQNAPYNGQPNMGYNNPQPFTLPPGSQPFAAPVGQRKTNKGLAKFIFLSIITFGIYALVVMSSVSEDINVVASRYDGKKTMHFCLLFFLVAPITLGIAAIVWHHNISSRIGNELRRRMIPYSFGAADYWLWNVLGCLIIVGPFIYYHKLFKATNLMCQHYNVNG